MYHGNDISMFYETQLPKALRPPSYGSEAFLRSPYYTVTFSTATSSSSGTSTFYAFSQYSGDGTALTSPISPVSPVSPCFPVPFALRKLPEVPSRSPSRQNTDLNIDTNTDVNATAKPNGTQKRRRPLPPLPPQLNLTKARSQQAQDQQQLQSPLSPSCPKSPCKLLRSPTQLRGPRSPITSCSTATTTSITTTTTTVKTTTTTTAAAETISPITPPSPSTSSDSCYSIPSDGEESEDSSSLSSPKPALPPIPAVSPLTMSPLNTALSSPKLSISTSPTRLSLAKLSPTKRSPKLSISTSPTRLTSPGSKSSSPTSPTKPRFSTYSPLKSPRPIRKSRFSRTSIALSVKTMQSMHSVQIQSPQSAQAVYSPSSISTLHTTSSSITAVDFTEEAVDDEARIASKERFSLIPGVDELVEMLDERESDESGDLELMNDKIDEVEEREEEVKEEMREEDGGLKTELVEELGARPFSRKELLSDWPFPAVSSSQQKSTPQHTITPLSSKGSSKTERPRHRPLAIRSTSVSEDDFVYCSRIVRRRSQQSLSLGKHDGQQSLELQQTRRHHREQSHPYPHSPKSSNVRVQRAQRSRKRHSTRRMSTSTKASSQFFPISEAPPVIPVSSACKTSSAILAEMRERSYALAVPLTSPISAAPNPKSRVHKLRDDVDEKRKSGKSFEEHEPCSPTVSRRRSAAVAMPNCIHELSKKFKRRPTLIGSTVFHRGARAFQRSSNATTKHRTTLSLPSQVKAPALSPLIEDHKYMATWPPANSVASGKKKDNHLFSSVSQFTLGRYSSLMRRTRSPQKVRKDTGTFFID